MCALGQGTLAGSFASRRRGSRKTREPALGGLGKAGAWSNTKNPHEPEVVGIHSRTRQKHRKQGRKRLGPPGDAEGCERGR